MLLVGIWRLYDIAPFPGNQRRIIVRMDMNNVHPPIYRPGSVVAIDIGLIRAANSMQPDELRDCKLKNCPASYKPLSRLFLYMT